MKQIISFSKLLCLLFVLLSDTLVAQPLPINHPDSLRILQKGEDVVRNAPLIFKGSNVHERVIRSPEDKVIVIRQVRVSDVIKGNIKTNDLVEVSYSLGWAMWDKGGRFSFPMHPYHPDVYWGNGNMPAYYFCKNTNPKSDSLVATPTWKVVAKP